MYYIIIMNSETKEFIEKNLKKGIAPLRESMIKQTVTLMTDKVDEFIAIYNEYRTIEFTTRIYNRTMGDKAKLKWFRQLSRNWYRYVTIKHQDWNYNTTPQKSSDFKIKRNLIKEDAIKDVDSFTQQFIYKQIMKFTDAGIKNKTPKSIKIYVVEDRGAVVGNIILEFSNNKKVKLKTTYEIVFNQHGTVFARFPSRFYINGKMKPLIWVKENFFNVSIEEIEQVKIDPILKKELFHIYKYIVFWEGIDVQTVKDLLKSRDMKLTTGKIKKLLRILAKERMINYTIPERFSNSPRRYNKSDMEELYIWDVVKGLPKDDNKKWAEAQKIFNKKFK